MSSSGVTISQDMMEKKQIKVKIGVGSVVKEKVGETKENTSEGIIIGTRINVVGCVHAVEEKNKFLVQFEDGKKNDMSSSSLHFLYSK